MAIIDPADQIHQNQTQGRAAKLVIKNLTGHAEILELPIAVRVDAGAREVVFRYRPRSVAWGAMITLLGFAAVLVLVLRKGSGARAILAEAFAR